MTSSNDPKKPAGDSMAQMLTDASVKLIKAEAKRIAAEMAPAPTPPASESLSKQSRKSRVKELVLIYGGVVGIASWCLILWNEPARPTPARVVPVAASTTTCTKSVTSEVKDAAGHVVTTKTETQTGPCQASGDNSAAVEVGGHLAKWAIFSLF